MAKTVKQPQKPHQGVSATKTETSKTGPQGGPTRTISREGRAVVIGIMGSLLGLFLVLSVLAPDTTRGNSGPDGTTVLWRLLFLMVPLGVMYFLLWGEKLVTLIKIPLKGSRKRRKKA